MKYCINFYRDFRYKEDIDEVIIKYKDKNIEVLDFLKTIPQKQRIILDTSREKDFCLEKNLGIFIEAKKIHKNIAIKLSQNQKDNFIEFVNLYDNNIDFFFDTFVDSWDTLMSYVKLSVSDVYIVNELGFELENVSKVCKDNKIRIRVFPNVAQVSSKVDNLDKLKSFFIRPDDIEVYEKYIDICEFFGPLDRQSVLYEIYRDKRWLGDLGELIIGLDKSVNNKTILPYFGRERINCNKKCYYGQCIICDKIAAVASQFDKAGIEIVATTAESEE